MYFTGHLLFKKPVQRRSRCLSNAVPDAPGVNMLVWILQICVAAILLLLPCNHFLPEYPSLGNYSRCARRRSVSGVPALRRRRMVLERFFGICFFLRRIWAWRRAQSNAV